MAFSFIIGFYCHPILKKCYNDEELISYYKFLFMSLFLVVKAYFICGKMAKSDSKLVSHRVTFGLYDIPKILI